MASYRIVCAVKQQFTHPRRHAHVVKVGTGERTSSYQKLWAVREVYDAMDAGDSFYTKSDATGGTATVHKYTCPHCKMATLRSSADAVSDNDIDKLPECSI